MQADSGIAVSIHTKCKEPMHGIVNRHYPLLHGLAPVFSRHIYIFFTSCLCVGIVFSWDRFREYHIITRMTRRVTQHFELYYDNACIHFVEYEIGSNVTERFHGFYDGTGTFVRYNI